jgi:hypothetical protein
VYRATNLDTFEWIDAKEAEEFIEKVLKEQKKKIKKSKLKYTDLGYESQEEMKQRTEGQVWNVSLFGGKMNEKIGRSPSPRKSKWSLEERKNVGSIPPGTLINSFSNNNHNDINYNNNNNNNQFVNLRSRFRNNRRFATVSTTQSLSTQLSVIAPSLFDEREMKWDLGFLDFTELEHSEISLDTLKDIKLMFDILDVGGFNTKTKFGKINITSADVANCRLWLGIEKEVGLAIFADAIEEADQLLGYMAQCPNVQLMLDSSRFNSQFSYDNNTNITPLRFGLAARAHLDYTYGAGAAPFSDLDESTWEKQVKGFLAYAPRVNGGLGVIKYWEWGLDLVVGLLDSPESEELEIGINVAFQDEYIVKIMDVLIRAASKIDWTATEKLLINFRNVLSDEVNWPQQFDFVENESGQADEIFDGAYGSIFAIMDIINCYRKLFSFDPIELAASSVRKYWLSFFM